MPLIENGVLCTMAPLAESQHHESSPLLEPARVAPAMLEVVVRAADQLPSIRDGGARLDEAACSHDVPSVWPAAHRPVRERQASLLGGDVLRRGQGAVLVGMRRCPQGWEAGPGWDQRRASCLSGHERTWWS